MLMSAANTQIRLTPARKQQQLPGEFERQYRMAHGVAE